MKNVLMFFVALLLSSQLMAQQRTVTGTVVDVTDNVGMIGATVVERGTSNGTVTDLDGRFSIRLTSNNPVLVFSSIGYRTLEVEVGNQTTLNVAMSEDAELLEELVVVGYGV